MGRIEGAVRQGLFRPLGDGEHLERLKFVGVREAREVAQYRAAFDQIGVLVGVIAVGGQGSALGRRAGRAQTAFLAMLAAEAGHPLDLTRIDPRAWMTAMVRSFYGDETQLAAQIRALIGD